MQEVGLPPGVVNILTGEASQVGEALVRHPDVNKIAFTGSTDVGRSIRRATAGSGKKLSLELGGKSPFIVFDDADLDSVVEGVVDAIWFNQGQVCCAGSRLLVQENIADRLIDKLRARMEKLRIGNPLDKAVDMGAIVSPGQLQRDPATGRSGCRRGCGDVATLLGLSHRRLLLPTHALYQRLARDHHCPGRDLWPCAGLHDLPHSCRSGCAGQQYALWAGGQRVEREYQPGPGRCSQNQSWQLSGSTAPTCLMLPAALAAIAKVALAVKAAKKVCTSMCDRHGKRSEQLHLHQWPDLMGPTHARPDEHEQPAKMGIVQPILPMILPFPPIDRTPKMFIKGKQVRPDSGYSLDVYDPEHRVIGQVGEGNRKDIRNAVEAAHAASGWATGTTHNRAQILYYIAENLAVREEEFARRIVQQTGRAIADAANEVQTAISRLFSYAAWADKYEGAVHRPPLRGVVLAMKEPIGVIGMACPDEYPLLGFISLVAPAIAMGNTVVVIPSQQSPLSATDCYQVFETSDLPAGVVNIVTGERDALSQVLTDHDDVDAMWYFGSAEG